jgi:hypothetical protein
MLRKPLQAFILNLVVQTWRDRSPRPSLKRWGSMKRFPMLVTVVTLLAMALSIVQQHVSVLRGAR